MALQCWGEGGGVQISQPPASLPAFEEPLVGRHGPDRGTKPPLTLGVRVFLFLQGVILLLL